jgi:SynChlorMet cassette protein ScmC
MPRGLRLCLADGQTWLIRPVDEAAAAVVAELGKAMRLTSGEKGRELYVAASGEGRPPEWSGSGFSGSVVCFLPDSADPDMRAVSMDRIASAIARESLARGGLLLHAALAENQARGFAMAGPSGVGKSTASSRLRPPWHSLCDDSTLVVRDQNSRWWAHPWPTWSRFLRGGSGGSWPVEHAVPLRAVFFLSQSPADQLEPVSTTQATALTMESAVSLAWEAYRLTDEIAARSLSSYGVRAAWALASAVPAYSLKTSLEGRFWDEIERVLPAEAWSESDESWAGPSPASVESLVARDSRRLVYTGASMNPTLVEPELLQVEPCRTGRVRPGDVVCFKSPDGDLTVVHRVVKVGADGIRTRGDNNRWDDERVLQAADIIGRVTAAQRGSRRRPVDGGWRGLAILRSARLARGIRSRAGSVPHKLFSFVVGFGPFGRLLPRSLRPRVVRFDARYRVFLKLLMGRLTVGQYDDRRGMWHISRPVRLLVDERDLLGPRPL